MEFSFARPDVVRAINQRWLLKFWNRHLGTNRVPHWQAVEAENISRMADNLSTLEVSGVNRFTIRSHGATIAQAYGSEDCRDKDLNDVIPAYRRAEAVAPYQQAVIGRCPVYTIQDVTDRNGRLVHYERLLLPFTNDGLNVDRILGSFELICADGAFDAREVMVSRERPPALRLAAIIEPEGIL
jgi:hypothetical protein